MNRRRKCEGTSDSYRGGKHMFLGLGVPSAISRDKIHSHRGRHLVFTQNRLFLRNLILWFSSKIGKETPENLQLQKKKTGCVKIRWTYLLCLRKSKYFKKTTGRFPQMHKRIFTFRLFWLVSTWKLNQLTPVLWLYTLHLSPALKL